MNDKQKKKDLLYREWRELIDELAYSKEINSDECVRLRNLALEIGYKYYRCSGSNVSLHT